MSGIYIPGMEIPKSCYDCPCIDAENGRCQAVKSRDFIYEYRPHWCPLIFVPDHGRLIDADTMEEECCHGCKNELHKYSNCIDCALAQAPTIIPANKETQNG